MKNIVSRLSTLLGAGLVVLCLNVLMAPSVSALAGYTWTGPITTGSTCSQPSPGASDSGQYIVCAGASRVVVSHDYGTTWTAPSSLISQSYGPVAVSASGQYMIATTNGSMYKSTDYGVNWAPIAGTNPQNWSGIDISANGQIITGAFDSNKIQVSNDGGTTWATTTINSASELYTVSMSNDGTYMYASDINNNEVYKSSNSGISWSLADSGLSPYPQQVYSSASGQQVIATSAGTRLFASHDYGTTWQILSPAGAQCLYQAVISSDGNTIIAPDACQNAYIFISYDSGVTWTHDPVLGVSTSGWWNVIGSADLSRIVLAENGGNIFTAGDPSLVRQTSTPATPVTNTTSSTNSLPTAPDTGYGSRTETSAIAVWLCSLAVISIFLGLYQTRKHN